MTARAPRRVHVRPSKRHRRNGGTTCWRIVGPAGHIGLAAGETPRLDHRRSGPARCPPPASSQACRLRIKLLGVVDQRVRTRARSAASNQDRRASAAPTSSAAQRRRRGTAPPAPPHPATTSPARTAGRIDRRRSIPDGRGGSSCCNSGSRPRSAQRANRFPQLGGEAAVIGAGRKCAGQVVAAGSALRRPGGFPNGVPARRW